ncbi:hypothetical protein D9599_01215 [Roseomonas sp. KE2513]|uniref:hypothetical protein n=1 Tax=Roseomonas sp. KE2513 TaxID=2479202 RepID=UPI0018DFCF67|nr:hypothetical protein [Roseomonas sp. KE2513]MBI0534194.1 hypothetical protein [Roseomonas sp. KE2513]
MDGSTGRRGALGLGGLLLLAQGARAQGPAAVLEELQGTLAPGNAGDFGRFVSQHAGRMVSMRVMAARAEGPEFFVKQDRDMLMVQLTRPEAIEIVLHGGFVPEGAGFALDGVFNVKAEGMQQGILVYGLQPLAEAAAREMRAGPVKRIALS